MTAKQTILQLLQQTDGYISGQELSSQLNITRAAVWKHIRSLRAEGYTIDSVTNRGYRLLHSPDLLSPESILAGLKTHTVGKRVFCFASTDSTNEEAKRHALQGVPDGSLFLAEEQTQGKGRLGRVWTSPPGSGLWFSVLKRTGLSPLQVSNMTLITGLAVCRAIRAQTGCPALIKWPNDIVIGSRKVCGILTEMAAEVDKVEYVIPGIGINVNIPSFPPELKKKATSLQIEMGKPVPRLPLLLAVLEELEKALDAFEENPLAFPEEYRQLCVSLNRTVKFFRNGREHHGRAVDISSEGELLVQEEDGSLTPIYSGEVSVQGIYEESF